MLYRIQPWSLMGRGVFHRWAVLAGGADSELGETRASYPAATTTRPTNGTSSGVFQGSTCRAGGTTKPLLVGRGRAARTARSPPFMRRWLAREVSLS